MISSSIQKITHKHNDTKLLSSSIHKNNTAPIRISVNILVCLIECNHYNVVYSIICKRSYRRYKKNSCFVIGKQTVELIVPEMLIVLKKTLFFMKYQWSGILHKEI